MSFLFNLCVQNLVAFEHKKKLKKPFSNYMINNDF